MKFVTIKPVDEPASFQEVKFKQADWKEAKREGEKRVPYGVAREALRRSNGLYEIKREQAQEVEVVIKGLKSPEEMTNGELIAEMSSYGKPPRKQMTRAKAIEFVVGLREKAAELIVDE